MRWIERMLWFFAAVAIGASVLAYGQGWVWQHTLNSQFEQSLAAEAAFRDTLREMHNRSSGIAPEKTALAPYIGRLEIPRLHLSIIILEGVDNTTLLRGVGHIPGTAFPGLAGNTGIAGHRDTFFHGLQHIRKSDQIVVTTLDGHYEYSVDSVQVVKPDDIAVLRDPGHEVLTLVTCFPFWIAGPAPNRFVVQASRTQQPGQ